MSQPAARLIGTGVFVLGGSLLFAIGLFLIGDRRQLFADQFVVHADFAEIGGLQSGAAVRVAGLEAGEVTAIVIPSAAEGKFRVRLRLRQDVRPLVRTDSVATIRTDGLVGNRLVYVEAGSEKAPPVADGGSIASREPFELADVLEQSTRTIDQINATIVDLRDHLDGVFATIDETAATANAAIESVSRDVETIARSGRRISEETTKIIESVRAGHGSLGKFLNDDELYTRVTRIARDTEEAVQLARLAAEDARAAITNLQQSSDGPMRTLAADVGQTVAAARVAMTNLAENTEALKRSVLVRGYFGERGYYNLDAMTPADYRAGALAGDHRAPIRVWLRSDLLFEPAGGDPAADGSEPRESLSADGRARIDLAMAELLRYPRDTPLIIESHVYDGSRDQRVRLAADRARLVEDYVIRRYALSPVHVASMPLGNTAAASPEAGNQDRIALTAWVDRRTLDKDGVED